MVTKRCKAGTCSRPHFSIGIFYLNFLFTYSFVQTHTIFSLFLGNLMCAFVEHPPIYIFQRQLHLHGLNHLQVLILQVLRCEEVLLKYWWINDYDPSFLIFHCSSDNMGVPRRWIKQLLGKKKSEKGENVGDLYSLLS